MTGQGLKNIGRVAADAAMVLPVAASGSRQIQLSELSPEELWIRGMEECNEEDRPEAMRYFEHHVVVGGTDPRARQARLYPGQAREEKYLTALEFTRLAADLGRIELADDARYMACRSYHELSPEPQLDQEKLYEAGDWDMRRRAYDSAIIYFEDVVEQYPMTEFAPGRVGKIYGMLEHAEEQEEVRERLLIEYPDSAVAQRHRGAGGRQGS